MNKGVIKYRLLTVLIICFFFMAGRINLYAQSDATITSQDTIKTIHKQKVTKAKIRFTMPDSVNNDKKTIKKSNSSISKDSINSRIKKVFIPNSVRATWLSVIIPGGGQIYNRKYWKLPIIYGGLAGCAYALSWNNKMYKDYAQAYRDLMDNNPNTNSYKDLLPAGSNYSTSQLTTILKNRKDLYRRYRDLSIFSLIGVYLLSIVDAYVDAELSNFDITPDLSMHVQPVIMNNNNIISQNKRTYGIQCSLKF